MGWAIVACIVLAQELDMGWALVNKVMNFCSPQSAGC